MAAQCKDVAHRYYKATPAEVEQGFFRRDSTGRYIKALAALDDVTLFAGAGASADVGAPLSDDLMPLILAGWAKDHPDLKGISNPSARDGTEKRVTQAIAEAYPPPYLGSIARELARHQRPDTDPEKTRKFTTQIDEANQDGYTTGGFLARSIGALAFALKREGRSVTVITTNYDTTIIDQQQKIFQYFYDLANAGYFLRARQSATTPTEIEKQEVPVFHINGVVTDDSSDALVIGEADFFAWYGKDLQEHRSENQVWRRDLLETALSNRVCLFVGSSLTDPDVLAKLAMSKYGQPRYAILLAPDQENEPDGTALLELGDGDPPHVSPAERCLARDMVAQRFLHLGVVPIMVDFPHQVPQLLTEVALRVQRPKGYKCYSDRLVDWWRNWAQLFGFSDELTPGPRCEQLQVYWRERLAKIRKDVQDLLRPATDEKIMLEVWVRNPKNRTLFLWSTSESVWLNGDTAHSCSLADQKARLGAHRAFRAGCSLASPIRPKRGMWEFWVSVPLTLHEPPWHHLPVGVVSVRSNKADKALWEATERFEELERLEQLLQKPVNDLLDPKKLEPHQFSSR